MINKKGLTHIHVTSSFSFQLGYSVNLLSCQSSNFVFGLIDTVRELLCLMTQSKLSCIRRNTLITSLNCMPSVLTTNGNAINATAN